MKNLTSMLTLALFYLSISTAMAGSLVKSQLTMENSIVSSTRTGTLKTMTIEAWRTFC
jgi:hypothetical protein